MQSANTDADAYAAESDISGAISRIPAQAAAAHELRGGSARAAASGAYGRRPASGRQVPHLLALLALPVYCLLYLRALLTCFTSVLLAFATCFCESAACIEVPIYLLYLLYLLWAPAPRYQRGQRSRKASKARK